MESEHDPLTPFFSISIEDLDEVRMSQKLGNESELSIGSNNSNALKVLTERNLELAKSLPDFDIVRLNSTSTLSGIHAYKIVYTFADPGSPLLSLFESMNIWTAQDDKALLFPIPVLLDLPLSTIPTQQQVSDKDPIGNSYDANSQSPSGNFIGIRDISVISIIRTLSLAGAVGLGGYLVYTKVRRSKKNHRER